jgi:rhodanese-related sulfurtransferase
MTPTLTPRPYQSDAVSRISKSHIDNPTSRVVLAASTGSGKTEMSIMIIEHFITSGLGRVLVIAHHTNIIKSNFIERLETYKPQFTFSDTDQSVDCFVTIRSSALDNVDASQFDLLIVDEAHQNYFAKTIQNITSCVNHQVLLTATPSKFVSAGGFDIIPIARLDIPNEFFADLHFRVVNSDTALTDDDYNNDNNIKTSKRFNRSDIKSQCDVVIPLLDDKKKLFICKDINQATSVANYLTKRGFPTSVSDSKSDADSNIANQFKSGDINSLCVVDRMRVGYSDNDLFHTIDMSFTHNPDVIMQILSRSNRGNQSQLKTYIKLTNNTFNLKTRFALSVALCLYRSDNLIKYDGNGVQNLNLPFLPESKKTTRDSSSPNSDNVSDFVVPDNIVFSYLFDNCDYISSTDVIRAVSDMRLRYDYDLCLEIAKKYTSYTDLCKFDASVRIYIGHNNLLDKFLADTGLSRRPKATGHKFAELNREIVFTIASQCHNFNQFMTKHKTALNFAKSNGFLNDLIANDGNYLFMPTRTCLHCNTQYRSKHYQTLYCSSICKQTAAYSRRKIS